MKIEDKAIKDIFADKTGRDLITCMSLIQPVTKRELHYFLDTLFRYYVFNVSKNHDYKLDNPFGQQKIPVVKKSTLDQKDRAFHKALDAGLIIEIPENNKIRNNFYMINSNLRFQISNVHESDNPLKINDFKNSKSYNITHKINTDPENYINPLGKMSDKYKKNMTESKGGFTKAVITPAKKQPNQNYFKLRNEKISLPYEGIIKKDPKTPIPCFNSISQIITLLHWLCCSKHRNFIKKFIENADEFGQIDIRKLSIKISKNEYFIKEAIENEILCLISKKPHVYQLSNSLMPLVKDDQSIEFFFARSYNPLFCFSNYNRYSDEIEKGISPVDLLNILTDEKKCKILPEKRNNLVFSSLLYKPSYFNIKKNMLLQEWQKNQNVFIPLRNTACIYRDIFDITSGNNNILNSLNDIDIDSKLSLKNYSHHGGFLFSKDRI